MSFKIKQIRAKFFIPVFIAVLILSSLGSVVYALSLRNTLIRTTNDYKTAILKLENRIGKLKNKVNVLEEEIRESQLPCEGDANSEAVQEQLQNELLRQNTYITNELATDYELQINPSLVSLNHIVVEREKTSDSIRFIVAGHPYGSPSKKGEITPSLTLINSTDNVNQLDPDLFFLLGDLAYVPSQKSYQELTENFLSKIKAPVFNAPGNHDFALGRRWYEEKFGQTFFYFTYGGNQIIILDTEIASCFIVGKQRNMLEQAINEALQDDGVSNIFVFTHKALFLDDADLRFPVNGRCAYGSNYNELRNKIFLPAAKIKPVYLIAGDVGAFGNNLSPFYNKNADVDFYTLAVGLGDSPNDVLLQIDVQASNVRLHLIPIGGQEFLPIEAYTKDYWNKP